MFQYLLVGWKGNAVAMFAMCLVSVRLHGLSGELLAAGVIESVLSILPGLYVGKRSRYYLLASPSMLFSQVEADL